MLQYNFEDEPFISFESYHIGDSEKFDASVLATIGFNVPMIYITTGGYTMTIDDGIPSSFYLWLEKDGRDIIRNELLVPIIDNNAVITGAT